MNAIEVRGLSKHFGTMCALDDVDLDVPEGSLTAVVGPSGSGKTTLLNIVAGFLEPDAGSVSVAGTVVVDDRRRVRPERRGLGYVPQEGALFPHLTVERNIGFGVRSGRRERVAEMLDLVGLTGLGHRYPHELSGGQQQRVALARALAIRPRVVLLDEPFSSLDASLRTSLGEEVARVLAATGTTAVLVTHDQDQALSLADRVVVLRSGRVTASGTPADLYGTPTGPEAARFFGDANVVAATALDGVATCPLGAVALREGADLDGPVTLLLRPEQLELTPDSSGERYRACVESLTYHGHDTLARVRSVGDPATELVVRVVGEHDLQIGQQVGVRATGSAVAWPATSTVTDA